jgi:hypothetical protein
MKKPPGKHPVRMARFCPNREEHYINAMANPKSEYRNSKQIRISNAPMTKTRHVRVAIPMFDHIEFWLFSIVSDFGFRASDLVAFF